MHNIIFLDTFITFYNIFNQSHSLNLTKRSIRLDILQQIATLTEFSDNIDIVLRHEDVNSLQYVGMFQQFEGIDLVVEEIVFHLVLYFG